MFFLVFSPMCFIFPLSSVRYPLLTAAYLKFLYYLWISVSWEYLSGGRERINSRAFEVHLSHLRLQWMTHSGCSTWLMSGSWEHFLLPELSWERGSGGIMHQGHLQHASSLQTMIFPLWRLKPGCLMWSQGCYSSAVRGLWQVEIWKLSQGHLDPFSLPGCHFWSITGLILLIITLNWLC